MLNGLAIWHYPHRTVLENVNFFADNGFSSVSMHGLHMVEICKYDNVSEILALTLSQKNIVLTVHHKLPKSHSKEDVAAFEESIDLMAKWQKKYGGLAILSFDVPQTIRDKVTPYLNYVLQYEEFSKVAVEDFGLTDDERKQIEAFKGNPRFGLLIDVGHMYIRLKGESKRSETLFKNSVDECPKTEYPGYDDFIRAFASKEFPIFEIHLHNNNGVDDLHYFLDDGTLDMQMIAKVLKEIRFDGVLTIESAPGFMFECKYPESDDRILKNLKQLKTLML